MKEKDKVYPDIREDGERPEDGGYRHETVERSEKVRELLGEMPPSLIRWGTVVIAAAFALLIAVVCLFPYPGGGGESILRHFLGSGT